MQQGRSKSHDTGLIQVATSSTRTRFVTSTLSFNTTTSLSSLCVPDACVASAAAELEDVWLGGVRVWAQEVFLAHH